MEKERQAESFAWVMLENLIYISSKSRIPSKTQTVHNQLDHAYDLFTMIKH